MPVPNAPTVRRTLLAMSIATGLLIGASGCSAVTGAIDTAGQMAGVSGEHSASDLMFAAMMIPHHKQAVEMSDLALKLSTNDDVRALAENIKRTQSAEIVQMQGWLDAAGESGMSSMPGHDHGAMDGMLDDAAMAALSAAVGTEFDALFLHGMIAHHEGALTMAAMVTSSNNAEAKALGEGIISSQTAEIAQMKALLG